MQKILPIIRMIHIITHSDFQEVLLKLWDNNAKNTSATAISTDSQIADKDSADDSDKAESSASGTISEYQYSC